ncbi:MAG: hypothetical protein PHI97_18880 [Desulfobulbus sp.]|nr:hypothetical protein [Desulfobulbus sp.]
MIVSCLGAALVSGCAGDGQYVDPYQARAKREAAMQQGGTGQGSANATRRDVLMPAMSSINTRIHAYEEKLKEWQDLERRSGAMGLSSEQLNRINECRSQLQDILLEYTSLQKQLQQETRVDAAQLLAGNSLLQLNQQDIDYLESGCGNFLAELKNPQSQVAAAPADPQIKAAFDNSDYDQVINIYNQMAQAPGVTPASMTTYQYGQALVKNHQEAEGSRVLSELLEKIRQQPGQDGLLLPLTQLVADLDFTREAYDDAHRKYEEVIKISIEKGAHEDEWAGLQLAALQPGVVQPTELRDFGGLLRKYLAYTPKRDGFAVVEAANLYLQQHPYTTLTPNVNLLSKNARTQADTWLNRSLNQAQPRVEDRPSPGVQISPVATPTPEQSGATPVPVPGAVVDGTQNVAPQPTPVADTQSLQGDYDKGVALLQAKEYDQAITQLNRLQNTALDAKAQPMIAEASKQAGQAVRQKAAELFVRASNSRDTDEKRKLLLSSRDLLQGILTKYPQSGLADKVQRNLARIDADLRALDTSATPRPVTSGGAYVPPKN